MELLWTKSLQDCTHHQVGSGEFCALLLVSRTFRILSADFTQQCLSSLKNAGLAASDAFQHEWEKATLAMALCERLETIERITDAVDKLGGDVNP
ncbi:hypothetical protein L210DRAFT_3517379 [Boletus edulis BED1]|uniref:Uncharacterized protein n=1 Tax=Boletus edulis BED1 TaxID=1328754 RepID=A0AAD4GMW4_BOLED|nr:hypothetical protein L210DRAFT_3517379 [Boletus edulis BED1]